MTTPYIEVNNNAVQLLRHGNYEAAVPTFLVALELFKQTVAAAVLQELQFVDPNFDYGYGPTSSPEARMARRKRAEQIPRDHRFYQSMCFRNDEIAVKTYTDRLHFHSRAFLLSYKEEDDPSAIHRRDGTSALILYNLAVSLHAQAIRTGDSQILQKAETVYHLALSSAEHWALYSGGTCSLLHMSILNNMALLSSITWQIRESTSCLRVLHQLVIQSPDLSPNDRDIFDWNVVLFMEGHLGETPAPAA